MKYLPSIFKRFGEKHPDILDAYQTLGALCDKKGPMDEKTRHLVQLGIAIGASAKGAVRSHARRALAAGATEEELVQTALLSMSIVGFPAAIAGFGWIEDVLGGEE